MNQGSIEGINWHATMDAFSTDDQTLPIMYKNNIFMQKTLNMLVDKSLHFIITGNKKCTKKIRVQVSSLKCLF